MYLLLLILFTIKFYAQINILKMYWNDLKTLQRYFEAENGEN